MWKRKAKKSIRAMWSENLHSLALKMEGDQEPRKVGSLSKLKKAKIWTFLQSFHKEYNLVNTLILAQWDLFQTLISIVKIINSCCFKSLSLGIFYNSVRKPIQVFNCKVVFSINTTIVMPLLLRLFLTQNCSFSAELILDSLDCQMVLTKHGRHWVVRRINRLWENCD